MSADPTRGGARSFPRHLRGRPVQDLDLVLRLLDHQVVGPEDEMLGKVEDLVLERRDRRLVVVGLVLGTAGWAARMPGPLGRVVTGAWRRLDTRADPEPATLSLRHVTEVGSAVRVDEAAARHVVATSDLELWLRRHLVAPLPGSGVDGDDVPDPVAERSGGSVPVDATPLRDGRFRLGSILGAPVRDESGRALGRVTEVHADPRTAEDGSTLLVVSGIVHGRHLVGAGLGYGDRGHGGPAVLATLVRWWHRDERVTGWADVVEGMPPVAADDVRTAVVVRAGVSRPALP